MKFDTFLQSLTKLQNIALTGTASHQKMAPLERIIELQKINFSQINFRKAAVLILFYPKNNNTHFVLIERNEYKGVHSKQISLPGGKKETFDLDLKATALRETFEEVGIKVLEKDVIKELSPIYVPPSNFMIYPFVGIIPQEITFNPDEREVKKIIEVPLSDLLNPCNILHQDMSTSYNNMTKVPYYNIQEYVVWGATAMILSELIDVVKNSFKI